jgi:uncharacterized protein (DUF58 family)
MSAPLGIDQRELSSLARVTDRRLAGSPLLPHGDAPRRDRSGRGIEFLNLRPYAAGDSTRDIDWRATARSRHPQIRRYRDEAFSSVYLCVDRSASMGAAMGAGTGAATGTGLGGGREAARKWQLAQQLAASLAFLLLHGGNRVGLLVFSEGVELRLPPIRGRTAYRQLLVALTKTDARRGGGATHLEACRHGVSTGSTVAVLSDFLAADFLRPGLDALVRRRAHLQLFRIRDDADTRLAQAPEGAGPVLLRDIESGVQRSLRLDRTQGELAATRRLQALDAELDGYCRARGIPITTCDTSRSWRDAIITHLRSLPPLHA